MFFSARGYSNHCHLPASRTPGCRVNFGLGKMLSLLQHKALAHHTTEIFVVCALQSLNLVSKSFISSALPPLFCKPVYQASKHSTIYLTTSYVLVPGRRITLSDERMTAAGLGKTVKEKSRFPNRWYQVGAACRRLHYHVSLLRLSCGQGIAAVQHSTGSLLM